MDSEHSAHRFPFDRPAVYRICVEGYVEATWSDRLADMTISHARSGEGPPTTTLVGELRDQTSLAGVLNTLYELHCAVLLVERIRPEQAEAIKIAP